MLILKGNSMKSDVVNHIMQTSNSICFEYSDKPVCKNSFYMDSTRHSLPLLLAQIDATLMHSNNNELIEVDGVRFDYIIIYTNVKESDIGLQYFINGLQTRHLNNWFKYKYKNILIACV